MGSVKNGFLRRLFACGRVNMISQNGACLYLFGWNCRYFVKE
jgi:hypothetical protein